MEKKTSVFSNALIWFGAAVSIAEILTGTLLAPLGFMKGMAASILGHVIGGVLLFLAGLIGGVTEKSSMETTELAFGKKGSVFFSFLNVIQLVGWTAVMIIGGSRAACVIANPFASFSNGMFLGNTFWSCVIALLIVVWILVGIKNLSKVNIVSVTALFVLTIVLSRVVFGGQNSFSIPNDGELSFGQAVELSVAMPLSWLPLIADYTKTAKKPVVTSAVSSAVYLFGSIWMYAIGLGAAIFTGSSDIADIMIKAGLGLTAIIIVIISTVTTTFLDVYSSGVSFMSITKKMEQKVVAIIACGLGLALAVFIPTERYESFLYLISAIFAPMIAVLVTDYFLIKNKGNEKKRFIINFVMWCIGFIIYEVLVNFVNFITPVGNTIPIMILIGILTYVSQMIFNHSK